MALPHFTNINTGLKLTEVVYKNLFEVQIILPEVLQGIYKDYSVVLLENTTSFQLPQYQQLGVQKQRFKYSTRLFLNTPESTSVEDLKLTFNMNVNDKKQIETWNVMKTWYDLAWNNENGTVNYKKNMVGTIVGYIHDKEGEILRRVTYHNCQPKMIAGWDGDIQWDQTDIASINMTFVSDYWEDYYY